MTFTEFKDSFFPCTNDWINILIKLSKTEDDLQNGLQDLTSYQELTQDYINKCTAILDLDLNLDFSTQETDTLIKLFDEVNRCSKSMQKILLLQYPTDKWFKAVLKKSCLQDTQCIFEELKEFKSWYWSQKRIEFKAK